MSKVKLAPPDLKQCQTIHRTGAFQFGPPGERRCTNKPTWIATERKLGKDGQRGSMSLCVDCMLIMEKQLGKDFATYEPVEENKDVKKKKVCS